MDIEGYKRLVGEIELALIGSKPPPSTSPDAWGDLAIQVACYVLLLQLHGPGLGKVSE